MLTLPPPFLHLPPYLHPPHPVPISTSLSHLQICYERFHYTASNSCTRSVVCHEFFTFVSICDVIIPLILKQYERSILTFQPEYVTFAEKQRAIEFGYDLMLERAKLLEEFEKGSKVNGSCIIGIIETEAYVFSSFSHRAGIVSPNSQAERPVNAPERKEGKEAISMLL